MLLKIGSRKSDLAREQAYMVAEALKKAHPHLKVEHVFSASLGDKDLETPLARMPEKGVFTEDFHDDLVSGELHMVVHSWKDLPVEDRDQTCIAATLPRADQRDLLLIRKDKWRDFKRGEVLGLLSSSPRRAYNLESFLPSALPIQPSQIEFKNIRGNVPTRMKKLFESEEHGLIVAKAAIDRLLEAKHPEFLEMQSSLRKQLQLCHWMVLPLVKNPNAAAQGALAIEVREDREDIKDLLRAIHCSSTYRVVSAEREILKSYGGGCHQRIGVSVLEREYGSVEVLRGITEAGEVLDRFEKQNVEVEKVPGHKMWPLEMGLSQWFRREPISSELDVIKNKDLWLVRADSLPENLSPGEDQLVWCGGIRTWKKLAAQGIWVHGCAEALGEQEAPRVETLAGRSTQWIKLTHDQATHLGKIPACATYKLHPLEKAPDLAGKTHLFWASGSSFQRALAIYPEIRQAQHFCGPGNTYMQLRKELGPEARIEIFVSYEHWKKSLLKTS